MLARRKLCALPTPLTAAERMASAIGVDTLLIKRDDLLGRGLGGNKLRKLEFIAAAALARGADTLVTTGAFESNHVCLTAIVARMLDLHAAAVLMGPAGRRRTTLNERIAARVELETRTVEYDEADPESRATARFRVRDRVAALTDELTRRGRRTFFVPEGGACPEGTCAFVEAFDELHQQMLERSHPRYDVFLAVGSGSTYAGLWCGARRAGADVRIRGVSIAHPNPRCRAETRKAARRVCEHLALAEPQPDELDITDAFLGDAYARPTEWSKRGVALALRTEGLLLDHTYTGKALGGMLSILQAEAPDRPVVFWHTGGVTGAVDDFDAA